MKILAIYFRSGSGISVFYERIIRELAQSAEVDVLSDNEPKASLMGICKQYQLPYTTRMQAWYRRFMRWFGITPISNRWSRKAMKMVANDYDVVLAFVATTQLTPAICGRIISQKLGCKLAIYTVDAVPGPGGWTRRKSEFWGKSQVVYRNYSAADYVASSNAHMLEYQLSVFPHKPNLRTDVLFTPSPDRYYNYPPSDEVLFLYTGTLYGLRNPDYFFKAFKRVLKLYPNAEVLIVGKKLKLRDIDTILTEEERSHITLGGHTADLEPLFKRATVLVDIDADKEKDPFLSSKIVTYLKVNRVILSETGRITPSRELFAGMNTVVQCDHNDESLYEGMLRAIEIAKSNPDFSEREPLIKQFSVESVSAKLRKGLEEICSK